MAAPRGSKPSEEEPEFIPLRETMAPRHYQWGKRKKRPTKTYEEMLQDLKHSIERHSQAGKGGRKRDRA